ncbi:MAG: FeoA domain-containing protein [Lachnospiraceae bacterium]|jgi:ferrous iron transport protein A|nr:FeoA domain-containing protein [Lachnospiraceae bacterium]
MTLDQAQIGKTYEVENVDLPQELDIRLEALGMTNGTDLDVMNAKEHGTVIIKLRGSRFALGRGITSHIEVKEVAVHEH